MLQGLFPPTQDYNTTLANGSTIVGQLGGYQPIPSMFAFPSLLTHVMMWIPNIKPSVESVEPDQDVSLEGWTDCNVWNSILIENFDRKAPDRFSVIK